MPDAVDVRSASACEFPQMQLVEEMRRALREIRDVNKLDRS
jgi:hypothetical protein